ncbi:MAG: hypothetical protein LUC34_01540 [Campylobacter sp.]|nr:hypothetical protein [Campylobacter sp.]
MTIIFCVNLLYAQNFVINDDKILSDKVSRKLQSIGDELYEKSGVTLSVGIYENIGENSLEKQFNSLNFKAPYAFLIIVKDIKKIEIFADEGTLKLFDKEQVLSPHPERGTILPILVSKNGADVYNAAVLNGYADIAEQIAQNSDITLINGIGNANKNTLNFLRVLIYGSLLIAFLIFVYR